MLLHSLCRSLVLSRGKEWGERSVRNIVPEKTLCDSEWSHCDADESQEDAGQYGQHSDPCTMYSVSMDKLSQEDDWTTHTPAVSLHINLNLLLQWNYNSKLLPCSVHLFILSHPHSLRILFNAIIPEICPHSSSLSPLFICLICPQIKLVFSESMLSHLIPPNWTIFKFMCTGFYPLWWKLTGNCEHETNISSSSLSFFHLSLPGEWKAGGPPSLPLSSHLPQSCRSVHHPADNIWSPSAMGWKPLRPDHSSQVSKGEFF